MLALAIPLSVVTLYVAHQRYQVYTYGRHLTEIPLGASSPVPVARMLVHLGGFGISSLMVAIATWPLRYPGALADVAIAIFTGGTMLALILSTRAERGALLAFALLAVATYGVIAAARASLYPSLAVPLETAAAVPRYHYLGPVWLSVMVCLALGRLGVWSGVRRFPGDVLLAGWIGFAAVGAHANGHAIDHHVEARRETERVLGAIRTEIASRPRGEPVFITNRSFQPAGFIPMPDGSPFPGWVAVFEIFFPENTVEGRRVFFVSDGSARTRARTGRITSLLVGSAAAPARDPARAD